MFNYKEPTLRPPRSGRLWQIDYINPDGLRRQLSAGKTKRGAEQVKASIIDCLLKGKDPEREMERAQHRASVTLDTFFDTFYRQHGADKSGSTLRSYRTSIKNIRRADDLALCPLSEVNYPLVQAYQEARKAEGVSNRTVNIECTHISLMLDHAVKCGELEFNPLRRVKFRLKENSKRDIDVTAIDPQAAIAKCSKQYQKDMLGTLFDAGLRKTELLRLRIEEIQFPDVFDPEGIAVIFNTTVKGGKQKAVGGGAKAREILQRVIGGRKKGYVFVSKRSKTKDGPYTSIHKGLNRVFRDMNWQAMNGSKFRIHDTLHWGVSTKINIKGWSLEDAQAFRGHDSRQSTEKYRTIDLTEVAKRRAAK